MQSYEIFTFIICLAAAFSYVNHRFLRLTPTVGIMLLSLAFSVLLLICAPFTPAYTTAVVNMITSIDFNTLLMKGMLGFLLFAGSIHIDAASLKRERLPVMVLATVGILLSTFIVGSLLHLVFRAFDMAVGYIYCLLFAALISPTDPIAVLAILKRAGLPKSLELKIAGESLFNDGVAVVVFLTILQVAAAGPGAMTTADVALLFAREAIGGVLWGLLIGYLSYLAMRSIDQYQVEVMITVATVMGGYLLADLMHISGPLAMVVAGIVIGSKVSGPGVSDVTMDYLHKFWELVDEMLNALLFMLVGLEMLIVKADTITIIIGLIAIVIVLVARWLAVAIPVTLLRARVRFEKNAIAILTWGGLRGGLSVALALSLPQQMYRDQFVTITYIVVVFSIIVQGLTIGRLYKRLEAKNKP